MTRTNERILFYISEYHKQHGHSPTWEEIRVAVGLKSKATVSYHCERLRAAGRIEYKDGQPRTVVVVGRDNNA